MKNGAKVDAYCCKSNTPLLHVVNNCDRIQYNDKSKEIMKFLLKYSDFCMVGSDKNNPLTSYTYHWIWKMFIEHISKLVACDLLVNAKILETISNTEDYDKYLEQCAEELSLAKNSKLKNSWVTYFDILVGSKKKLKNLAGNKDLIEDFMNASKSNDLSRNFPIYGTAMLKNIKEGMERRESFDKASILLSINLPIFNPNHLVVRDVLDCITSTNDLSKLSSKFCLIGDY